MQQTHAEAFFQLGDASAELGLGDVQRTAGSGKTTLLHHLGEVIEGVEVFHGSFSAWNAGKAPDLTVSDAFPDQPRRTPRVGADSVRDGLASLPVYPERRRVNRGQSPLLRKPSALGPSLTLALSQGERGKTPRRTLQRRQLLLHTIHRTFGLFVGASLLANRTTRRHGACSRASSLLQVMPWRCAGA